MNEVEEATETCEICDHPESRYQFEVQNELIVRTIWVGSECIKRFSKIRVLDRAGRELDPACAAKRIDADRNKLLREAANRFVISALIQLAQVDADLKIESFVSYYRELNAFTPNQMSLLIWRMVEKGIEAKPQYFKVSIRRGHEQNQLPQMEEWKLAKLRPYLPARIKWPAEHRGLRDSLAVSSVLLR